MSEPVYDLEERTFEIAKKVRSFIRTLPRTISNTEDIRQLVRSSGSVGANYIEANESLGHKDFLMKLRITRKEAKESIYWLRLISEINSLNNCQEATILLTEAFELKKIFSAIIEKCSKEKKQI